jgi:hypothetical protein
MSSCYTKVRDPRFLARVMTSTTPAPFHHSISPLLTLHIYGSTIRFPAIVAVRAALHGMSSTGNFTLRSERFKSEQDASSARCPGTTVLGILADDLFVAQATGIRRRRVFQPLLRPKA